MGFSRLAGGHEPMKFHKRATRYSFARERFIEIQDPQANGGQGGQAGLVQLGRLCRQADLYKCCGGGRISLINRQLFLVRLTQL